MFNYADSTVRYTLEVSNEGVQHFTSCTGTFDAFRFLWPS